MLEDLTKVWFCQAVDISRNLFSSVAQLMLSNTSLPEWIFCVIQEKPSDPDVFRLLGEVKYRLKDYEGSANAYKSSAMVSFLWIHS